MLVGLVKDVILSAQKMVKSSVANVFAARLRLVTRGAETFVTLQDVLVRKQTVVATVCVTVELASVLVSLVGSELTVVHHFAQAILSVVTKVHATALHNCASAKPNGLVPTAASLVLTVYSKTKSLAVYAKLAMQV
jgi:hypothetical protein